VNQLRIGNRFIGAFNRPYFIADIAANHDGNLERALNLIELAKESGADAAKFQNFKAEKIVSDFGFSALKGNLTHQKSWSKSVVEVYRDASIDDAWTPVLKQKCDEVGIEYMTSPYDFASVDWATPFVNCFKIGSGEISWPDMLTYIAGKQKPVLLATGAATWQEVQQAVQSIVSINPQLVLMQCNTNYTGEAENFKYLNLNVLKLYAETYPDMILGLSDHTVGYISILGAVALGARVIEKHFTDDRTREGPDHKFSTTPSEWREMVDASNRLFDALGDGVKRIEENERDTSIVQKRGLYTTRAISAGEVISKEDMEPLRPRSKDGYEPYEADSLIGRKVGRNLSQGEMLRREDVIA